MASEFSLRWNNHHSTLISVLDSLLERGTFVDVVLAAEGQFINVHRVVLCACSQYFESLLTYQTEKQAIVFLKDVSFADLRALVNYMYRGEVNISQDQLAAFLQTAEALKIKGLGEGNKKWLESSEAILNEAREITGDTELSDLARTPSPMPCSSLPVISDIVSVPTFDEDCCDSADSERNRDLNLVPTNNGTSQFSQHFHMSDVEDQEEVAFESQSHTVSVNSKTEDQDSDHWMTTEEGDDCNNSENWTEQHQENGAWTVENVAGPSGSLGPASSMRKRTRVRLRTKGAADVSSKMILLQGSKKFKKPVKKDVEDSGNYPCLKCSRVYKHKNSLDYHERFTCDTVVKFFCPFCSHRTHCPHSFKRHVKSQHYDEPDLKKFHE